MKFKTTTIFLLMSFWLAACGFNPVQELKESVVEKAIEESTGSEEVNLEIGEDSVSFSVEDENGNKTGVSTTVGDDLDTVDAFGFIISIPEGLESTAVQRMENGQDYQVIAQLKVVDTTEEQFFPAMHEELISHGFEFDDLLNTGAEKPDPTADKFIPNVNYKHADGHTALIVWGSDKVVMTFKK